MQVSSINDVKVYNLSSGQTLPEWLTAKQRQKLQRRNDAVRRRIQLIQDFEMPDVSGCIQMSRDGNYIMATGTYKPVLRCYEVQNLSLKFERCLDAEVVKMAVLSDGFDKVDTVQYKMIAFLEEERWLEFHTRQGHYFRTRIPKFGRDMVYHEPSCELYIVGCSPEVYRFSLEEGRFMQPLATNASSLLSCAVNPVHHLFVCGTAEGTVEAWDPRCHERVSVLDCALHLHSLQQHDMPHVTALHFKDGLTMAAGCSTGQTLLYDVRAHRPLVVRDQQNGLPIKQVEFSAVDGEPLVLSLDSQSLKLWYEQSARPYTAIQPDVPLNQLCLVKDSGLMLLTNESPKMHVYYMPSLGPAPTWCAFLDNMTEELEESDKPSVFDGYQFVTAEQLGTLGLSSLIGTNLLRAYMHGYFMDTRLYSKALQMNQPFEYENYRKKKIKEKVNDELQASKVSLKPVLEGKLPSVNRDLAVRLQLEQTQLEDEKERKKMKSKTKKRAQEATTLLSDDRFSALFKNPDFHVDPNSEEYQLLNPALEKLGKSKQKRNDRRMDVDADGPSTSAAAASDGGSSSSSEDDADDRDYQQKVKDVHRKLVLQRKLEAKERREQARMEQALAMHNLSQQQRPHKLRVYATDREDASAEQLQHDARQRGRLAARMSMAERVSALGEDESMGDGAEATLQPDGGMTMTFTEPARGKAASRKQRQQQHVSERRAQHRSGSQIERRLSKPKSLLLEGGRGGGQRGRGRGRGRGAGGRGRASFRGSR